MAPAQSVDARAQETSTYSPEFFEARADGSRQSADIIVPLVLARVDARSVVDFGCGTGSWLAAFSQHGVSEVLGIDGDYVDVQRLEIPADRFLARDLTQRVDLPRSYDLAVSVEVAEHLDAEYADKFVTTLTNAASVVLFSAACPHQGGNHHVNERWPSYWERLFRARGFVAIDAIRPLVWCDEGVDWWYVQNMLIFCRENELQRYPSLASSYARTDVTRLDIVHPRNYLTNMTLVEYWMRQASAKQMLLMLPSAAARGLRRRLRAVACML